jgi:hypothetical protein
MSLKQLMLRYLLFTRRSFWCVCDRFHQSLSVVYLVCECVCLHRHHCVCHDCGSEKRQKRKKKDSMKTQSPLSSIDREVCVSLSEFREPSLHPSNSHSLLTQFHFVATANYHTRDRRVKQKTRKQGNGMKRSKKKRRERSRKNLYFQSDGLLIRPSFWWERRGKWKDWQNCESFKSNC